MRELESLPRTRAYLERLPARLDSYPDCEVKGSMVRGLIEHEPPGLDRSRMPPPLLALMEDPPLVSAWVPEVGLIAATLAMRELAFDDDATYLAWVEQGLQKMLSGRLYRVLFSVISPHRMARSGAKRWGALRTGTSREHMELNENGNLGRIHYPDQLYDPLYVEVMLRAFLAIYRLSRAPDPVGRVLEWSPTSALVEVVYDRAKPRGPSVGH